MKHSIYYHLPARAAMVLLALIAWVGEVKAQQALPYEYGFENGNLAEDGWVLQGSTSSSGIYPDIAHSGSYGFAFKYDEQNAYLLSPVFTGSDKGIELSFWYSERTSQFGDEQFQVGYTTDETVTDASLFTYGDVVTASTSWQEHICIFPAGTKRIAIKYIYGDRFYLYLDDFAFKNDILRPSSLAASDITFNSAVLSWTENGEATAWEIILNDDETNVISTTTNPFTLTGLEDYTPYTIKVRAVDGEKKSGWSNAVSFTTPEQFARPTEVTASNIKATSVTIGWTGTADSYNLRYRKAPFSEGFESCTDYYLPSTWTTIDADGDGYTWYTYNASEYGGNIDKNGNPRAIDAVTATSASYNNQIALTPDNWLISPRVSLNGTLSLWVRGQDPDWAGEHFAIYLSTTGKEVDDFTTVLIAESVATGVYVEYTADLSAYAGKKGYIAIRHFNITDMFRLNVDNITITDPSTNGEWVEVNNVTSPYTIEGLDDLSNYEVEVQAVYSGGESRWSPVSFTTLPTIELPDDATGTEISDLLTAYNGETTAVQLTGRTLYKDGEWNTLCLPFDLTLEGSPLAGATAKALTGATMTGTHVTLTFSDVEQLQANVPYIIKWEAADQDINDPVFSGVTIATADETARTLSFAEGNVKFTGYYDAFDITAEDDDIYYMTAGSTLKHTGINRTLKPLRAYFRFSEAATGRRMVLDFGDGTTTGIADTDRTTQAGAQWYTIDGKRLDRQPLHKGLYIKDGQKVVIR